MLKINGKSVELCPVIPVKKDDIVTLDVAAGGHWYGHGFNHNQPYPLEKGCIDNSAFAVNNIQCPIWMCSAGYVFFADTFDLIKVKMNTTNTRNELEIIGANDFNLKIFSANDLPTAWRKFTSSINWRRPTPAPELIGDSLFCTWTQYPRAITGPRIVSMAKEIRERGYPCSTIIIDDRWEANFGELEFGADFPNPDQMIDELHKMDFKVILWVTPFINNDSKYFSSLAENGSLVRSADGKGAAEFRWWGGTAGLIDLTTPQGAEWYRNKLVKLKNKLGVDGFKIDGGDAKYMPSPATSSWGKFPGPSGFSDILLETFEKIAPGMCETRTAWMSQNRNIIWRLGGKDSHWGDDNGLKALVNLSLHLSLAGYDILIPDMVPGRVQTMDSSMALPTDELMIRWTEASVLMPLVQFSYYPWNYAENTNAAVLQFARLHKALQQYIVDSANDMTAPLIRPLWFDEPGNRGLYEICDEFLLGKDLLVCPIMDENVTKRDITLPNGEWLDAWTGESCAAGTISGHPAPCPGIPLFVRAENIELFETINPILKKIVCGSIESGVITATHQCGLDRDLSVTG